MTTLATGDAPDQVFRCTHFCCLLTKRACLRRQTEQRAGAARHQGKKRTTWSKPMHPHCASGDCPTGREVAAELAGLQLPAAVDPRQAPRLDIVAAVEARATQQPPTPEDTDMPKTICASCKSPSKHRDGCKGGKRIPIGAAAAEQGPVRAAPARRRPTGQPVPALAMEQLQAMRVEDLVALRDALEAEMDQREARLQQEAEALRAARRGGARARQEAA